MIVDSTDHMTSCSITDENGIEQCTCERDAIIGLLANTRRRAIVSLLETVDDDWVRFDRLVDELSASDDSVSAETLAIELHHQHLPPLEDQGVIEYDAHGETIRYYHCELVSDVLDVFETSHPREGE